MISTAKLEEALEALKGLSGEAKTRSIVAVLDEDHDGNINLDEIAEVSSSCDNLLVLTLLLHYPGIRIDTHFLTVGSLQCGKSGAHLFN